MAYTATYPRLRKTHPVGKNRVWDFLAEPNKSGQANRRQPPQPRRGNRPVATKPASGVRLYGYRHYDPVTGRWPSRDPISEGGAINIYSFVDNSPLTWFDVLGREKDQKKDDKQIDKAAQQLSDEECAKRRKRRREGINKMLERGLGRTPDCSGEVDCELTTFIIELPDPCRTNPLGYLGHTSIGLGDDLYDFARRGPGNRGGPHWRPQFPKLKDFVEHANENLGHDIIAFEICSCAKRNQRAREYFQRLYDDGAEYKAPGRQCTSTCWVVFTGEWDSLISPKEAALKLSGLWELSGKPVASRCGNDAGKPANIRRLNHDAGLGVEAGGGGGAW